MTTTDPECLSGRNVYDPRVRELVCATGNPDLFAELKIPKSTLRGWLNGEFRTAVGTESVTRTEIELYSENARLRQRVRVLQAVMCRLLVLIRAAGCRLDGERLPDGAAKSKILTAIGKVTKILALASVLKDGKIIETKRPSGRIWPLRAKRRINATRRQHDESAKFMKSLPGKKCGKESWPSSRIAAVEPQSLPHRHQSPKGAHR